MKLVTFTRDMRPHCAGETRVVPDHVAAALVAEGSVEANPPSFPPQAAPAKETRVEPPRQSYQTKRSR